MRTFLGVLMVLFVSGDEETVTGIVNGSVLLPCNCSKRNLDMEFKWQMDEPNMSLVLKYDKDISNFSGRYEGRAKLFLPENSNNCSVLLTNITADDQGKYKCIFYSKGIYKRFVVNLNMSASYNVCQNESTSTLNGDLSVKVFQCDARGHHHEAEIQWSLDGQPLTDSSEIRITHAPILDAPAGFHSELTTKLNWTSKPQCDVKAEGVSPIIERSCRASGPSGRIDPQPEHFTRIRYLIIIPIMLVLGFSMVLWCHCRVNRR